MGDGFGITIVSILFAVFGIFIGFHLGEDAGGRVRGTTGFFVANLAAVLAGSFLFMVVWMTGYVVLGMFAIGAVAGATAGLKFGYGESVGPWAVHDKAFNVNRSHRETAEKGCGEERRRRRASREDAPDLISVEKKSRTSGSRK